MSDMYLVRHCAPTLAGLKTGSLFTCPYGCREELFRSIRRMNQRLLPKGLRVLPLRCSEHKALIYIYRPKKLTRDLTDPAAAEILQQHGYDNKTCERSIVRLVHRLREQEDFPHEIGLFLGYPPEDVRGFIEHRECDLKCVGCWKVYGDAAKAQKTFRLFRKCSELYRQRYTDGTPIERLTVAEHTEAGRER